MSAAAQICHPATGREFSITRMFDAPRELVWQCFTAPNHMKEWWGRKGSTIVASTMDLRVGGTYHGAMRDRDGRVMWAKFVYREIVPPELLVWVHSFSDEAGGADAPSDEPDVAASTADDGHIRRSGERQDQTHPALVAARCR